MFLHSPYKVSIILESKLKESGVNEDLAASDVCIPVTVARALMPQFDLSSEGEDGWILERP